MRTILTSLSLALMALVIVLPTQAQTGISVGGSGSSDVTTDDISNDTDASVDTNVSADAGADDIVVDTGTNGTFSLTQKEAASASVDAESAEMSADAVVGNDDLSRYATSMMKRDPNIVSIDASSDRVVLAYRSSARFLGFIPSNLTARVIVDQDGMVDVSYPWYRFLFSVSNAVNEDDLEASLSGVLAAQGSAGFDAMARARIIERIHAAFSGTVVATPTTDEVTPTNTESVTTETETSAETSASTETSADSELNPSGY
jgi:hypothetical protein